MRRRKNEENKGTILEKLLIDNEKAQKNTGDGLIQGVKSTELRNNIDLKEELKKGLLLRHLILSLALAVLMAVVIIIIDIYAGDYIGQVWGIIALYFGGYRIFISTIVSLVFDLPLASLRRKEGMSREEKDMIFLAAKEEVYKLITNSETKEEMVHISPVEKNIRIVAFVNKLINYLLFSLRKISLDNVKYLLKK